MLLLVIFGLHLIANARAGNQADSLEHALINASDTARAAILTRLSAIYQSVDPAKSIDYDLQNLALQRRLGNTERESSILNNLGVNCYMQGDYAGAMNYFSQSLALREKLTDTVNVVKTLNNLGVISQIVGDFDGALEYLQRSLLIKLQLHDTLSTAKTLNNIGVIYKDAGKFDDARRFLQHALDLYRAVDDSSGIAAAYNNLGQVYDGFALPDTALMYFNRSLQIKRRMDDLRGIANTLNNIGMVYGNQGKSQEAIRNLVEAISIRKEINDQFGLASAMNNLGNLYLNMDNPSLAYRYFRVSLHIAQGENLMGILQRNYAAMADYFEKTSDPDSALVYYKLYTAVKDSIYNQNLNKQLANLKIHFQNEKSKKENEILRQENRIQELQLENNRKQKIQFVTVIFLLFFASVIVVLFLQYRNNNRLNDQLQQMNAELEARVKSRTAELEAVNATKDRFMSIIAHDLKSPFNALLGFADILCNDFDELGDHKRREIIAYLKDSAEGVYGLLENLLDWSAAQTGRLQLQIRPLDVVYLANLSIQSVKMMAEKKRITLILDTEPKVIALADEDTLRTVLRNLLTNAIKFTSAGGRVVISIENATTADGKKLVTLEVRDNGRGIPPDEIEDIFVPAKLKPSTGTENETGTGLGLPLSREFVRMNNGQLLVESTFGEGSTFRVILPAPPDA